MKQILFLFIAIPFYCSAQTPAKGTNTIVISNVTGEQAVKVFIDHGYMIGSSAYGVITTIPKKSPNHITIIFELEIKDSTGYLRGTYDRHQIVPGLWKHAESYGGHYKGGSFEIMDSLARSFNRPIKYIDEADMIKNKSL